VKKLVKALKNKKLSKKVADKIVRKLRKRSKKVAKKKKTASAKKHVEKSEKRAKKNARKSKKAASGAKKGKKLTLKAKMQQKKKSRESSLRKMKKILAKGKNSASGGIYAKTVVNFGKPGFRQYMSRHLCPIARQHAEDLHACPSDAGKYGKCEEYFYFKDEAQYQAYREGKFWKEKAVIPHIKEWTKSMSFTDGGPHKITKEQYEEGKGRSKCKQVLMMM